MIVGGRERHNVRSRSITVDSDIGTWRFYSVLLGVMGSVYCSCIEPEHRVQLVESIERQATLEAAERLVEAQQSPRLCAQYVLAWARLPRGLSHKAT